MKPVTPRPLGPVLPVLLVLFVLAGCGGDPAGTPAVSPDRGKVFTCPDLDGDGYSPITLCGPADCNDDQLFATAGQGYCPMHHHLEYDPPDGVVAADFALIEAGGLFRLYYIKGPFWQQNPDTDGKAFGYATSADGLSWTDEPDALTVDEESDWDDAHIWSPCVVRNPQNGRYYMFYTGVTYGEHGHEERIGLATSPNLRRWTRANIYGCEGKAFPGCLWEPDFPWNAWSEEGAWTKQCRDPWVWRDDVDGCWYMVYSTTSAPFDYTMVLGLARSDDLLHWTDLGPLDVARGPLAESPVMVRVDGLVHLMWTSSSTGGISHATTYDPVNGPWSAVTLVPGSDTEWHLASELLDMGGWFIYGYVPDYPRTIDLRSLVFAGSTTPEPGPLASLLCDYVDPAGIHPGAVERDNGLDDNCNGLVDEGVGPCIDEDGDLYGNPASIYCSRLGLDCNDHDPNVHPGAVGDCANGIDDDCNGVIDDPLECSPKFPLPTSRY